ncbi:Vps53-like protein [Multifurca ochricompacta]|uniref:Vps53-like protein n=1 Tax=Multifurca ochricompacta TaxID=376703 RepID=A0AAD4QQT5_9AGAM|nr:Vps53-like protein [Multifurca ochricompacta]
MTMVDHASLHNTELWTAALVGLEGELMAQQFCVAKFPHLKVMGRLPSRVVVVVVVVGRWRWFSHDLTLSIQRILDLETSQETDPLDTVVNRFDAIDVINRHFPDEESLGQLDSVQAQLAEDEMHLRDEIVQLQEELKLQQDPSRMQLIQEMISDLLGQMSLIREKATESEAIVRNITRDIQVLDLAKKNLILSMTTLKRLQMLVNALSQLEDYVKDKKYPEITQSLSAVKEISTSFKPYTTVPRIGQLWMQIQELQGEIRTLLESDFDTYYLQTPGSPKPATITAACATADILGPDVRAALTARYTALLLAEYRRVFRLTDEAGQLDNISRRYAWFRRILGTHEIGLGRAFLSEWKVGWWLVAGFIDITRGDMTALLSKAGKDLTVTTLLDVLQQTKDFELSMAKKFGVPLQDILQETSSTSTRPLQSISSAFEPHMGVYVRHQDKAIADLISSHRGPKARVSLDTNQSQSTVDDAEQTAIVVLPSSTELFYVYGQTLEGCATLSTGKPLFDLLEVFKKWLRVYAEEVLISHMRRTQPQPRRSADMRYDINEIQNACLVINTAEYCQTTAQELEEKVRQRIYGEFKERISLQTECDLFISVASAAVVILLREVEAVCEPALSTLTHTTWVNHELVTGQSQYVGDLVHALESVSEAIVPLVESKKFLRNFFDKASSLVITRFTNALVRSKPLKENGAEQLLIDLSALKSCLLKLPGETLTTPGYTRSVTKSTQRLEALLKVVVTPQNPAEGFILNYTLLIGDASFSNFQKIIDLKGTPRAEQNDLLDFFVTMTSIKPELEQTSFLTALDMDPPITSTLGLTSPNGSRVALPGTGASEAFLATLGPPSFSNTPPGAETPPRGDAHATKQVFSDIRRLMSFAVRRDTAPQ